MNILSVIAMLNEAIDQLRAGEVKRTMKTIIEARDALAEIQERANNSGGWK